MSVKGSDGVGSITDFDGNYSVNIPEGSDTLIFSYIGFLESQVNITGKSTVNVNLSPDVSELDEVVVVGYGTVLKRDLTGSVASVKVEDNIARQSVTIDQLLQGRAAGVQVTQNAANPNSGISVRIRGTNSLRGITSLFMLLMVLLSHLLGKVLKEQVVLEILAKSNKMD